MFENIIQNNGFNIALSGIIVVFTGLILIASTIYLFNKFFERLHSKTENNGSAEQIPRQVSVKKAIPIPDEELVAIATAIECYSRIHFETLQTQITFKWGEQKSTWTSGQRFGQRLTINKRS